MADEENQGDVAETKPFLKGIYKNHWAVATIILAVILLLGLFSNITGNTITGSVVSSSTAGEIFLSSLQSQGADINSINIKDISTEKGLYKISFDYQDQPYPLPYYVTKDGSLGGFMNPLTTEKTTTQSSQPQEIPKSDKPKVELFIMTHCPYGTQAEKGIIPTIEALGNKIDGKIRFVHYMMHEPEKDETPIQICIREEQPDKFLDYLKAFLEKGDTQTALTNAGIDKTKLDNCIKNKYEELYGTDSTLSEGYGVQGSPTLVINGVQASSGRDSQSYLNTICSAFTDAPEICNTELSSTSPSPGFGYETGSDTGAQC